MTSAPPVDERLAELPPPRPDDRVRLWLGSLVARPGDVATAVLSAADRDRLAASPRKQATQLLARRALLATVAGAQLGCPPSELSWWDAGGPRAVTSPDGRRLHVSVSVAGTQCLLAVSPEPVGVDLERITDVPEALDVAALLLSPSERVWVERAARHGPDAVTDRFLRIWVRKEAVVKCTGTGLTGDDPRRFSVSAARDRAAVLDARGDGTGLCTVAVPVPGAVAALAIRIPDAAHRQLGDVRETVPEA